MQNNVSRTETNILKGVAIIMMLWLHLFMKPVGGINLGHT